MRQSGTVLVRVTKAPGMGWECYLLESMNWSNKVVGVQQCSSATKETVLAVNPRRDPTAHSRSLSPLVNILASGISVFGSAT